VRINDSQSKYSFGFVAGIPTITREEIDMMVHDHKRKVKDMKNKLHEKCDPYGVSAFAKNALQKQCCSRHDDLQYERYRSHDLSNETWLTKANSCDSAMMPLATTKAGTQQLG